MVAGCGEVKPVLEALMRTCLSGHTTMDNANKAIQGVLRRFPTIKDGPLAGSVDWNAVRLAPRQDLIAAIKVGGIWDDKSFYIKECLDMVYNENEAMRKELLENRAGGSTGHTKEPSPKALKDDEQGATAMARLAEDILINTPQYLTLDYLHPRSAEEVFEHLQRYIGIGEKTAACVLLFCMQRPLFAVDTHVWKLCKWLGWVPATASRERTFAHCNERVPNELKYSLHQLMIAHGKQCFRCDLKTSIKTPGWDEAVCVLENLLQRIGSKKGGVDPPPKHKKAKKGETDADEERVAAAETPGTKDENADDIDMKDAIAVEDISTHAVDMQAASRNGTGKGRTGEGGADAKDNTMDVDSTIPRKKGRQTRKARAKAKNREASNRDGNKTGLPAAVKTPRKAKALTKAASGSKKRPLAEMLDTDESTDGEDSANSEESSNGGAWRPKASKKAKEVS